MSTPDIQREQQKEDWGAWTARSLARLWEEAGSEGPWNDAAPDGEKISSEGEAGKWTSGSC
jgi:hypothetical protein